LLRSGKETKPAILGHGTGPLLLVLPVNTGQAMPSPVPAHCALFSIKKMGPKAQASDQAQLRH
jgi:hypothetical protein